MRYWTTCARMSSARPCKTACIWHGRCNLSCRRSRRSSVPCCRVCNSGIEFLQLPRTNSVAFMCCYSTTARVQYSHMCSWRHEVARAVWKREMSNRIGWNKSICNINHSKKRVVRSTWSNVIRQDLSTRRGPPRFMITKQECADYRVLPLRVLR